jgi:glycosyltransferase involved in cell wall biosynthesis
MRVCINPIYKNADRGDGGIRRVSDAQVKYLPEFGIQVTDNPDEADLIANHGAGIVERLGVPMVSHNHGLMWESYNFGVWGDDINKHVIEAMARAQAITAPSKWVAHAITRGMLVSPEVVYHGVDADDWAHDRPHLGYVLWNKARADQVSDPRDMQDVAALLPDVPFLSTFGRQSSNVALLGAMPYETMKPLIQQAGVYLATARETFGIGTLEAMAAGVPVAGWRYGGQEEIVIEGETGYLAEYGDYDALAGAIRRCLAERDRLSKNCISDIQARWQWKDKIGQYAALYHRVYHDFKQQRPKVSVIVTCHNLARYLPDALGSVLQQTATDWECLIIDDQSTDITEQQCAGWMKAANDTRFRYIKTPSNLKLSGARNYGASHAKGKYILFLDADDMLNPNALDILSNALDNATNIHVAFGHLDTVNDRGEDRKRNQWPGDRFDWHAQIAHLNQLPYAAMMRREVFERSGGYRARDWRAEDASLWTRLSSFGVRIAKVTDESTLIYRLRSDSKSRGEDGDGDWTAWLPWRLAGDPREGMRAIQQDRQPNAQIVPFGAQGDPPAPRRAWPVHHHQHPIVSVIIPVGPGHEKALIDALDSVQAQTMPFWECIVIDDTGAPAYTFLTAHPWARVITTKGRTGAGAARNIGLKAARAPLVLFLDADDVIVPRTLEALLRGFVESGGTYTYSDWLTLDDETRIDGAMGVHEVEEYDQRKMLRGLMHAVTALIPTDVVRSVGGFDEKLKCFEDWDLFCKLAIIGACGTRVPQPMLIYRRETGKRTRAALRARQPGDDENTHAYTPLGEETAAALFDRYAAYRSGEEIVMPCGTCGGQSTVIAAQQALDSMLGMATGGMLNVASVPTSGTVRMEFIGNSWGAQTYIGKASGRVYKAGRDTDSRYHDVDPRDVEHLAGMELFRVVPPELLAQAASAEDMPMATVQQATAAPRGRKR